MTNQNGKIFLLSWDGGQATAVLKARGDGIIICTRCFKLSAYARQDGRGVEVLKDESIVNHLSTTFASFGKLDC